MKPSDYQHSKAMKHDILEELLATHEDDHILEELLTTHEDDGTISPNLLLRLSTSYALINTIIS